MRKRYAPPGRKSILHEGSVKSRGPHQRASISGCVQALNTSRRGASNTRTMTSSRSAVAVAALILAAMFPLPDLQLFEVIVQPVQALFPKFPVSLQPLRGVPERPGFE